MKKFFLPSLLLVTLSFSSCDLLDELIPDIDTELSKSFQIQIYDNSGTTEPELIDVTTSEEYNDFKDNIEGFELRKVTYEVKNYNTPDDMYFSGDIICSNEENTESFVIGSMLKQNIASLSTTGGEIEVPYAAEAVDKVLAWLDSPGRFKLQAGYKFTNADDIPYVINGTNSGSNFELVIKFYVTVKTQSK